MCPAGPCTTWKINNFIDGVWFFSCKEIHRWKGATSKRREQSSRTRWFLGGYSNGRSLKGKQCSMVSFSCILKFSFLANILNHGVCVFCLFCETIAITACNFSITHHHNRLSWTGRFVCCREYWSDYWSLCTSPNWATFNMFNTLMRFLYTELFKEITIMEY